MKWRSLKKKRIKKEIKFVKYSWFDWFINYIPKPIKNASDLKDKILSLYDLKNIKIVRGKGKN